MIIHTFLSLNIALYVHKGKYNLSPPVKMHHEKQDCDVWANVLNVFRVVMILTARHRSTIQFVYVNSAG